MDSKNDTLAAKSERLWTMDDLMSRWSCSEWTIRRKINNRQIPFIKVGPRKYRFNPEEVREWEQRQRVGTVSEI